MFWQHLFQPAIPGRLGPSNGRRRRPRRVRSRRRRLRLEGLESRHLLTGTFTLDLDGNTFPNATLIRDSPSTAKIFNTDDPANLAHQFVLADADFDVVVVNGAAEDNRLTVDFTAGDPFELLTGGVTFHGGADTTAGDSLAIVGSGLETAVYVPDAVPGSPPHTGSVQVDGGSIAFTGLEGVDIHSTLLARLETPPESHDTLQIANGLARQPFREAIRVTGTLGNSLAGGTDGVRFADVAFHGNAQVTIDTSPSGTLGDGDDRVTIAAADNDHQNERLDIMTGAGADRVELGGDLILAGSAARVRVDTQNVILGGRITAGEAVELDAGAGAIVDRTNDELPLVTTTSLALRAANGMGDDDDLDVSVVRVAAHNAPLGTIQISNDRPLIIDRVGPLNGLQGAFGLTAVGPISVADGVAVTGSGTLGGPLDVQGELVPGPTPGILQTADVSFRNGARFAVDLEGPTPSSPAGLHDQLQVTGTVSLDGGVQLLGTLAGPFPAAPIGPFVIIANDGTEPVTGHFVDLPQQAVLEIDQRVFTISYDFDAGTGSDGGGNDVALLDAGTAETEVAVDGLGNLVITDINGGLSNDNLTIQSDTTSGQFVIHDPQLVLTTTIGNALRPDPHTVIVPFAEVGGDEVRVDTLGGDDTLTVNYDSGSFTQRLVFDAGQPAAAVGDRLVLAGSIPVGTVTHTLTSPSSGTVDTAGSQPVAYAGIDTVSDQRPSADLAFVFRGGDETITLADLTSGGGRSRIQSTSSVGVSFANPGQSLVVQSDLQGGGGVDRLHIEGLDPSFDADLTLAAGVDDTVAFQTTPTRIGSGRLTVAAMTVTVDQPVETTAAGTLEIEALQNIHIGPNGALRTVDGNLAVKANEFGVAGDFHGVEIHGAVHSMAGDLLLSGQGGTAIDNRGVVLQPGSDVRADGGELQVIGKGGSGGARNHGVLFMDGDVLAESVLILGTAGPGPGSVGVLALMANVSATNGGATWQGISADALDIDLSQTTIDTGSAGTLKLQVDDLAISPDSRLQGAGELVIEPRTPVRPIAVGGVGPGLSLNDDALAAFADGFASITIGDPANGSGGIEILTATFTDPLTLAGGTIADREEMVDLTNTDAADPLLELAGDVAPGGGGVATFATVGDTRLAADHTLSIDIGGATAGTGPGHHDALEVVGTLAIGTNTVLSTTAFDDGSGSPFVPADGDQLVIVNNDGSEPIQGTFAGLAEGDRISSDFLGSGVNAYITYQGGSNGNDVALLLNGSPTIGGTLAGQTSDDSGPLSPFGNVTIRDASPALGVTIALSAAGANGRLRPIDGGAAARFTLTAPGVYRITDAAGTPLGVTAAEAESLIRLLEFLPTPNQVATGQTVSTVMTIEVDDGVNPPASDDATTVIVSSLNDPPAASDDAYTVNEDTLLTIAIPGDGLLANDIDPDVGAMLAVSQIDAISSQGAAVTAEADGRFTYDPTVMTAATLQALREGQVLNDTFTYTVSDGELTSTAVATVAVSGINDAPLAAVDTAQLDEAIDGLPAPNRVSGNVLANDTDVDDSAATFRVTTAGTLAGSFGTLVIADDGTFSYMLDDNNPLIDSLNVGDTLMDLFDYVVSDDHPNGNAKTDSNQLLVTIHGANDQPTAFDDRAMVTEDNAPAASGNLIAGQDGIGTDNDPDDERATLQVVEVAGDSAGQAVGQFGRLDWNPDGSYTYTLDPNFQSLADGETTTEAFAYAVSDPGGRQAMAQLEVTATGVNDPPAVEAGTGNQLVAKGTEFTVQDIVAFRDVDLVDQHLVRIDWDFDGLAPNFDDILVGGVDFTEDSTGGQPVPSELFTPDVQHTYPVAGLFSVLVEIDDQQGGLTQHQFQIEAVEVVARDDTFAASETGLLEDNVLRPQGIANPDTTVGRVHVVQVQGEPVSDAGETVVFSPLGATITIQADGSFAYDPAASGFLRALPAGVVVADTWTYAVATTVDPVLPGLPAADAATVTVNVQGLADIEIDLSLNWDPVLGVGFDPDNDGSSADAVTLSQDALGDLIVTINGRRLPVEPLQNASAGGTASGNLPLNQPVVVRGTGDDETLTVDLSEGSLATIDFVGNAGINRLELVGGTTVVQGRFDQLNRNDGRITLDGQLLRTFNVGPIQVDLEVMDVTFAHHRLADEAVTATADGGELTVSSSFGSATTIIVPQHSVAFEAGGDNQLVIGGFSAAGVDLAAEAGLIRLGERIVTGAARQTFTGPVVLQGATELAGSAVHFEDTVDGSASALTIDGEATFMGNVTQVAELDISRAAMLQDVSLTTSGSQHFGGIVTASGTVAFLSGDQVTFDDDVVGEGDLSGPASVAVTAAGPVLLRGGASGLGSFSVDGAEIEFDPATGAKMLTTSGDVSLVAHTRDVIMDTVHLDTIGNIEIHALTGLFLGQLVATGDVTLRVTNGGIADGNPTGADIRAKRLTMEAATGIGSARIQGGMVTARDPLETQVVELDAVAGGIGIFLVNEGALQVARAVADPAAGAPYGVVDIRAASPLHIISGRSAGELCGTDPDATVCGLAVHLTATVGPDPGDDLVVHAGARVHASAAASSAGGVVRLTAGDRVHVKPGAAIQAASGITIVVGELADVFIEGDVEPDPDVVIDNALVDDGGESADGEANPWHNRQIRWDVDDDGYVTPHDVLRIVNHINNGSSPVLGEGESAEVIPNVYLDVNNDRFATSLDALHVINFLNRGRLGEGEAAAANLPSAVAATGGQRSSGSRDSQVDAWWAAQGAPTSPLWLWDDVQPVASIGRPKLPSQDVAVPQPSNSPRPVAGQPSSTRYAHRVRAAVLPPVQTELLGRSFERILDEVAGEVERRDELSATFPMSR